MLLLSPMCMEENGESSGVNFEQLGNMLGITLGKDNISAAASITEIAGFNSTWKSGIPGSIFYQAGSLFKIKTSEKVLLRNIKDTERKGIGIRREEGFGQVLFINDFEKLTPFKEDSKYTKKQSKYRAYESNRAEWINNNPFPEGLSRSQIGNIEQMLRECIEKSDNRDVLQKLDDFFNHNINNRGAEHGKPYKILYDVIKVILGTPLSETLKCDCDDNSEIENTSMRYELISDWIRHSRKEDS